MKKFPFFIILLFVFIIAFAAVFYVVAAKNNNQQKKQTTAGKNSVADYFDQYISEDFYNQVKAGNYNRKIYPEFSDRAAWEKARKNKHADRIIKEADAVLKDAVPQLNFSEFRRFAFEGNRSGYENLYFARRKNLGYLATALCLTGDKEKYMSKVLDYAVAIMEEFSWTIPAHVKWQDKMLLDTPVSDLFASETGAQMAVLYQILGKELDMEFENFSEKLRYMILGRTVYNIVYNPDTAKNHWWYNLDERKNNWTPWCSYNNILISVILEDDGEKMAHFIRRFLQANAYFVNKYGEDGYCAEGPTYYNVAGMKLFQLFHILHKMRPGSMEKVFSVPKIRAMFEFIAHVSIGNKYQVNFGDSYPALAIGYVSVGACSQLLNSKVLQDVMPGQIPSLGGNGSHLNTCMRILFDVPESFGNKKSAGVPFSYFKDRLAIMRSDIFSASLKAGDNGESHNHNDLGHFTVFYKGQPLIVDGGTEIYSRKNFNEERYTLWYTRGSGHNAPVFGDTEQLYGKEYTAKFIEANENKLVCDLGKAYPEKAGVKKFNRTLDFSKNCVKIKDEFELEKKKDAVIKLLAVAKVEKLANGDVKIGDVILKLDGIKFEKFVKLPRMNGSWRKFDLTEIYLKSSKNKYEMIFVEDNKK